MDTSTLVSSITNDHQTQDLLNSYGLKGHKVTWEDTARNKGSCWGPNISDMTLFADGQLMPVIRKPNFSDVTDDVSVDKFKLRVGNEKKGAPSKVVGVIEYLKNLSSYTDNTHNVDLSRPEDTVVLTSSQCCVLPVQKGSSTEFCLQLFNYQSYEDNPAVLVILASKDGTSAQIVERKTQKLFFNDNGDARWFKAERLQDYRTRKTGVEQKKVESFTEMKGEEKLENVIMMLQIPLKVKPSSRGGFGMQDGFCPELMLCASKGPVYRSMNVKKKRVRGVGMDMGMLGLGKKDGKFVGTKDLTLERDTRFPIRCTFQYYRVTDENFISEHDVQDIQKQLSQAHEMAVASGSLVTNEDTKRVTEPDLKNPVPTDNPFGKLDEREYLEKLSKTATDVWGQEAIATFI